MNIKDFLSTSWILISNVFILSFIHIFITKSQKNVTYVYIQLPPSYIFRLILKYSFIFHIEIYHLFFNFTMPHFWDITLQKNIKQRSNQSLSKYRGPFLHKFTKIAKNFNSKSTFLLLTFTSTKSFWQYKLNINYLLHTSDFIQV